MKRFSAAVIFLSVVLVSCLGAKVDEQKFVCLKDGKALEVKGTTDKEKMADCKKKAGVWQQEQKSGGGGGW
jgi:hypothetical protein